MEQVIQYRGHKIEIKQDSDPTNPIQDWDMVTTFVSWHSRYDLSCKEAHKWGYPKMSVETFLASIANVDFDEDDERYTRENLMKLASEKNVIKPYRLYDHSGLTVSTGSSYPFNCRWDSMGIGFVFIPHTYLEEHLGGVNEESIKTAEGYIEGDVKTFDEYLTGEVYGYNVDDYSGDSCWGYYGRDGIKQAIEEAKSSIDHQIDKEIKDHCAYLKKAIKGKIPINYRKQFELVTHDGE